MTPYITSNKTYLLKTVYFKSNNKNRSAKAACNKNIKNKADS